MGGGGFSRGGGGGFIWGGSPRIWSPLFFRAKPPRRSLTGGVAALRSGTFDTDGLLEEFERYPEHERGRFVACGGGAAIAAMMAARALGATEGHVLKYAHSGDVSGDRSAVVGYLAAAFTRGEPQ